jgi:hypothetical protein
MIHAGNLHGLRCLKQRSRPVTAEAIFETEWGAAPKGCHTFESREQQLNVPTPRKPVGYC